MGLATNKLAAPDWDALDVELTCPRCGYNLRLLTVPRCPECGLEFDWEELIAAAQRRVECPLFEYHWRDRPIRSFFGTLGRCLIPWKVWTTTSLAVPPRAGPLLAMIPLVLLVAAAGRMLFLVLYCTMITLLGWGYNWQMFVSAISSVPLARWCGPFLVSLIFALGLMWLSTQVYVETFARGGIRQSQLARITLLSWGTFVLWRVAADLVIQGVLLIATLADGNVMSLTLERWFLSGEIVTVLAYCVTLSFAFTAYLRLERGWREALLSCAIAVLGALTIVAVVTIQIYGQLRNPITDSVSTAWPGVMYVIFKLTWS